MLLPQEIGRISRVRYRHMCERGVWEDGGRRWPLGDMKGRERDYWWVLMTTTKGENNIRKDAHTKYQTAGELGRTASMTPCVCVPWGEVTGVHRFHVINLI